MKRLMICALATLGLSAAAAQASTPGAWADLKVRSDRACLKASGLKTARVSAYSDLFEAVTVSTVEGTVSRKARKPLKARMFCVFDKRTGKVEVQDATAR